MTETKRRGLIVWLYSLKQINQLKKHGTLHYVSKKMKYAVVYIEDDMTELVQAKLERLHFVRSVEVSRLPDIDHTFEQALEQAKQGVDEYTKNVLEDETEAI